MRNSIVALDIETVPRAGIMDTWYPQWAAGKYPGKEGEDLEAMAALYPEFGQICCVCWGDLSEPEHRRIPTVYGIVAENLDKERELLETLSSALDDSVTLVGHNIKGFDIPFLTKRYLAHHMQVPPALRLLGKKPWKIKHLDTMELMRFGSSSMSLRSASLLLDFQDPKQKCDGVKVWDLFKAGRMSEIQDYCSGDVRAVGDVYFHLHKLAGLEP